MTLFDFSCPLTIISLILSSVYFLLFFFTLLLSIRLFRSFPSHKRQSQKSFLFFSSLLSLIRCIYFISWCIIIGTHNSNNNSSDRICDISAEKEESSWMNVLGSLPSALFLSAFTVNVYTFARIYHTVLTNQHRTFKYLFIFLIVINSTTYMTLLFVYFADWSHILLFTLVVYLYVLSACSLLVAIFFLFYGIALYRGVKKRLIEKITASSNPTTASSSSSLSSSSSSSLTTTSSTASLPSLLPNDILTTPKSGHISASFSSASLDSFDSADSPFPFHLPRDPSHLSLSHTTIPPLDQSEIFNPGSNLERYGKKRKNRFTHSSSIPLPPNSLNKLLFVSISCCLCFLLRSIVLPLIDELSGGDFLWWLVPMYTFTTEILPLLLILAIFDVSTSSHHQQRSPTKKNKPAHEEDTNQPDHDSEYYNPHDYYYFPKDQEKNKYNISNIQTHSSIHDHVETKLNSSAPISTASSSSSLSFLHTVSPTINHVRRMTPITTRLSPLTPSIDTLSSSSSPVSSLSPALSNVSNSYSGSYLIKEFSLNSSSHGGLDRGDTVTSSCNHQTNISSLPVHGRSIKLDKRRGLSYEEAFRQDLRNLVADD